MLSFLKNWSMINCFCWFKTLFSILFSKQPIFLNKFSIPSLIFIYLRNVSKASVVSLLVMVRGAICGYSTSSSLSVFNVSDRISPSVHLQQIFKSSSILTDIDRYKSIVWSYQDLSYRWWFVMIRFYELSQAKNNRSDKLHIFSTKFRQKIRDIVHLLC